LATVFPISIIKFTFSLFEGAKIRDKIYSNTEIANKKERHREKNKKNVPTADSVKLLSSPEIFAGKVRKRKPEGINKDKQKIQKPATSCHY
jgi:hypothetical protein